MTASCPIYAQLKRVSLPGLCTSFEINPFSKEMNVASTQLEFRSKENTVTKLNNLVLQIQKLNEDKWNTIDNLNLALSSAETCFPLSAKKFLRSEMEKWKFCNIRKCNISNFVLSPNIKDQNLIEMLGQSRDLNHQSFM